MPKRRDPAIVESPDTGRPDTGRPDTGLAGIAAMVADAEDPARYLARVAGDDPAPGLPLNGVKVGEWEPDELGLPPDCPIIPLGVDGDVYWFLDTLGQLRPLEVSGFGQKAINSLFMGRHLYLYWAWPRHSKEGDVVHWRQEKATETLMAACARKGPWNAVERARGRGAWRLGRDAGGGAGEGPSNQLAVHCGTRLWVDGSEVGLGEIGGDVYMTRPPIMKPWPRSLAGRPGPALTLYPMLKSWNWARPDLDPVLLLGWIGAAMIGGALPWRPAAFITGDTSTGKSTLQKFVKALFGASLIQSANTTAAGIYQLLKADALPVAIDELEGTADTRRTKAVMELARAAADNTLVLRGGESHQGVQFYCRSCFLFSSINTPPLEPQDWNRMAMLGLYRLASDVPAPLIDEAEFARLGRQVLRRMIDGWPRWATNFAAYREALAAAGHNNRGQNTFGVLMACADILVDGDAEALGLELGPMADDLAVWTERLDVKGLVEYENAAENWRLCLDHILSARVEAWRAGTRQTVGEVLEALEAGWTGDGGLTFDEARKLLQQAGLGLKKPEGAGEGARLLIPNQHKLLHDLFRDTKWAGQPGAGVWAGALRQAPQELWRVELARVTGIQCKGTALGLGTVLGRGGEEASQ